jgi:hypothetical protein
MIHDHPESDPLSIPSWLLPPYHRCVKRLKDESRSLHLSIYGLEQVARLPEVIEILIKYDEWGKKIEQDSDDALSRLEEAKQHAEWIAREAATGFPILHSHSIVGIWGILEVFCEDFAVMWLENVPEAWEIPQVTKLKIPLSHYHRLSESERPRFTVSELSRSTSSDLRRGVGKLKSLLEVFSLAPTVGQNVNRALHELCQVRNVIVHCGGIADKTLIDECPWLGLEVGEPIDFYHPVYGWYFSAAMRYSERVLNQAFIALGLPSCKCPGADEIYDRPVKSLASESKE